jgi:hypothetical protein
MSDDKKIEVKVSFYWPIVMFWFMGFLFTWGICLTESYHPTVWESLWTGVLGYFLWPGVLGLYIAKLLGTY